MMPLKLVYHDHSIERKAALWLSTQTEVSRSLSQKHKPREASIFNVNTETFFVCRINIVR